MLRRRFVTIDTPLRGSRYAVLMMPVRRIVFLQPNDSPFSSYWLFIQKVPRVVYPRDFLL